jgi:hypothetical protein
VLGDRITGGSVDSEHTGVVAVAVRSIGRSLCTGTLIAENLVLTARHCVTDTPLDVDCEQGRFEPPYAASELIVATDAELTEQTAWYEGRELRVLENDAMCGFDMALIVLATRLPSDLAEPLVPRIDVPVQAGELYTAIGYGLDGLDSATGGVRRRLDSLRVSCSPGSCGSLLTETEFAGEAGPCWGDSGGPSVDGAGRVFGVASRGGAECSGTIYSSVSAWRDLLMQSALDAASLGGYRAPAWSTTGSSERDDAGAAGASSTPKPVPSDPPSSVPSAGPLPEPAEAARMPDEPPPTCAIGARRRPKAIPWAAIWAVALLGSLRRHQRRVTA